MMVYCILHYLPGERDRPEVLYTAFKAKGDKLNSKQTIPNKDTKSGSNRNAQPLLDQTLSGA